RKPARKPVRGTPRKTTGRTARKPARKTSGGAPRRCSWPRSEAEIRYHDEEWCVPTRDDRLIFEYLVLESAQAGLSWRTILDKREGYRRAFAGFRPRTVAAFGDADVARLLSDASIVRNRAKILSAINNARRLLEVRREFGTFARYLWQFAGPLRRPGRASSSPESEAMARDMRSRGFTFVGPLVCYSLMQAVGMIDDHEPGCRVRGTL
ncbi:MAG: DNA-3-methyladenine glycosylase I, partial [Nitrosopumilus sp.]|nr:DNA-3-methyladenine glycosylase I [Nitrosopumilus sp.]